MPRQAYVPDRLRQAPFRGSHALADGLLSRRQLQSGAWIHLLRDVYVHRDVEITEVVRGRALLLVMPPDAVLAGRTAAWLYGVWRPRPGLVVPLDYARPRTADSRGISGAQLTRRVLDLGGDMWSDVKEISGVPVLSPMRTCFDLMRRASLVEAVVVVDAFAHAGLCELPWLSAYVDAHHRWPGVCTARLAVELASPRSGSVGESRLRMVVVLAGFPPPLVNPPVYAGQPMILCGYPDLVIVVGYPVLGLEYDGAYHDDADQRQADNRRENKLLSRAGLPLLRYGARSVLHERHVIVSEIAALTGLRPLAELRDADFRRSPAALAW